MRFSGFKRPFGRPAVWFAGAVALTVAVGISGEASARKATVTKAYGAAVEGHVQPQKPLKLRYFGGPKSVMYPE
jgi:hypothetical protein